LHFQHDGAGNALRLFKGEDNLAAHHQLSQFALAYPGGADPCGGDAALPEHRHPVSNCQHFIQFVTDKNDGMPAGHHALQGGDEFSDFLRCQHRGRLIQDEDARAAVQHLQDLDPLLLAHTELPDLGLGIHLEAVLFLQGQDALVQLCQVENETRCVQAEDDVFGDGLGGDQHEVLVYHTETGRDGIARGTEADSLAFNDNRALFRLVESGQDIHQGALACAVLAEQRVHFALAQIKVDMIVGKHAWEALDDPAHFNSIDDFGHAATPVRSNARFIQESG